MPAQSPSSTSGFVKAIHLARQAGTRGPIGVNSDPMRQPDERLRALNAEQPSPQGGPREDVFCTKVGREHPEEMYIVAAHVDGLGHGEGANDDGSGMALVMELARILNAPGVSTDRTIRFALWNNEETGLNAAAAYVEQRKHLQGIESPKGSGRYPEPRWLGMIQHDMMMFDHGMQIGAGWNPHWHQPTDLFVNYADEDFLLGLDAAQTTLAAVARLAGARVAK